MYFGDFLIEEKVISSEQLVEALCLQVENMPNLLRVIINLKLIKSEEMLEVLKFCSAESKDVFTYLKEKGVLNQTSLDIISNELNKSKIPLGEILLGLKIISSSELEKHLSKFKEKNIELQQAEKLKVESATKEDSSAELSEAALESLRELGIDVSAMESGATAQSPKKSERMVEKREDVMHFLNTFNEKQKNKILKLIEIIDSGMNKGEDVGNYFNSLFRDVHLLKGATAFSDIVLLDPIIGKWDMSMDTALAHGDQNVLEWCRKNLKKFKEFLEQLWVVRNQIAEDESDLGIDDMDEMLLLRDIVSLI